jgi:hypothetical protein
MQQEIEKVIDAIWSLEEEIQKIAYRDLENISRHRHGLQIWT